MNSENAKTRNRYGLRRLVAAATVMALGLSLGGVTAASATPTLIKNGAEWRDSSNQVMKCQGGNITKFGSTYYWVCSDLADDGNGNWTGWNGVYIYASTNLVTWSWQNTILAPSRDGAPPSSEWMGRANLLYNSTSGQYVVLIENGGGVSAATSSTLSGNYVWQGRIPNTSGFTPTEINDMSVFTVGSNAYIVANNDKNGNNRSAGIWRLNPSNYLSIDTRVFEQTPTPYEAHDIFERNGTYYWFASGIFGWYSTSTAYRTATSLAGPWSTWQTLATSPTVTDSFNTQFDFVVEVAGSQTTSYLYAGDRYSQYTGASTGFNAWYPLSFNGSGVPTLNGHAEWTIDTATGNWAVPSTPTNLLANPGFESNFTSWTTSGGSVWAQIKTNNQRFEGAKSANIWNDTSYTSNLTSNAIAGLTAGQYAATARVFAGGTWSSAYMQILRGGSVINQVAITAGTWKTVSIPNIQAANGDSLSVRFIVNANANAYFYIDNVAFYRVI